MKYKQPKEKWPAQRVYQRISLVKKDMSEMNRHMNAIDGHINHLKHVKKIMQAKISKKSKYLGILGTQLKEALCVTPES